MKRRNDENTSKLKKTEMMQSIMITILGFLIAFVMIFPIIWLFLSSFKTSSELFAYPLHLLPSKFTFDSYIKVIKDGFFIYIKNSLFLAVVGTLITVIISAMCGYAFAIYRNEIKFTNKVFGIFLLGTLIPGEILTISQFTVICDIGLYDNVWGVILPVVTTTTGIFMYRQHYMSIPLSLVESARLDGASEFKIFKDIMLPLGSSVTVTLTIFSFLWRWNDYILPLMVLSDQKNFTIQIAIKSYIGTMGVDWNSILAASMLSILPIIMLFIFLQKYITGGIATTGVKG
jgi:alpha-1,4-digalacturonate transport system permease protein